ncbi:MAG: DUF1176 domain-containing protein [Chroococcidiopsidaceae cyanobacterium CP_BM_ER_R8_30]|nr:DUF1176 domain-containing protein [Chroococcidiopsidaceae cyanobacterium CP_BM_ER_R8_30]
MIKQVLGRLIIIIGLPLIVVSYVSFNRKPTTETNGLTSSRKPLKVVLPAEKAFGKIDKLAENKHYIAAIENLQHISQKSEYYKKAQELKSQLQQKVIETLEACPQGFDSTALRHSSFYKASHGKYIVQVECYLSASQPAYEYYLYTESFNIVKVKPLDLTQFELEYHRISQEDSNFITGLTKFNQNTHELIVSQKYGAIGDCGTLGRYKFEKNRFMLKQFLADFKCGDKKLQYEKIYPGNVHLNNN